MRILPKEVLHGLATLTSWLIAGFAKKELKQLQVNVANIYKLPPHSHFAKIFKRQCVRHQVFCMFETLRGVVDRHAITIDGIYELRDTIEHLLKKNKGMIIATAHLGSWELLGHYLAIAGNQRLYVLAKPARYKFLTKFIECFRNKMGAEVIWSDQKTLLRDMVGAVRNNKMLGMVMDQKPKGRVGPQINFLGYPAEFVTGPATLSIKTGCPIITAFCLRERPWHYRLHHKIVLDADHQIQDEQQLTAMLVKEIEQVIKIYPEQWTWNYRRWRF